LDHRLTLDEFNKAFRKNSNVLCKPYPQRRDEKDQYEADINEIAHNYGPRLYIYHKSFSAKAANAIVEHNVLVIVVNASVAVFNADVVSLRISSVLVAVFTGEREFEGCTSEDM
jgi:hypothetical protein